MAILSTNQRLINVGDSYSAGNGIDITNNIISVTGDNAPYSAGDNIDIQDHIISGKDWSNDIENASANAYNVTTAWVQDNYANSADMTYISAMVDTKLDTSAWSSVSGDLATESYVIMADNITYERAKGYVDSKGFATEEFVNENTSGKLDSTAFDTWQQGQYTNDIAGLNNLIGTKLDASSFEETSGTFYTNDNPSGFITGVDLSNYYTKDETSGAEQIAQAIANIPVGDPEVNAYVFNNSASIDESKSLVESNSSFWNDISSYQINSANYITEHQSLEGLMSASLLESADGKWTAYNSIPFKAGDEFPASADEAIQCVQTNSANWQNVSSKLDTNVFTAWSATQAANNYQLSAGDGISIIDDDINKITRIDVTAGGGTGGDMFTAYLEYNDQNQISGYAGSAFAGQGGGGGNPEVESYVQTNSANIDETVTSFQTNSSTYMVEPNLEYNAVGEISGYGNSAIAQYGAEKQWLVHDDTLVHAANSAQYALGVAIDNVARLLGVDETVLYNDFSKIGHDPANGHTIVVSEPCTNFRKIGIYVARFDTTRPEGISPCYNEFECYPAGNEAKTFQIYGTFETLGEPYIAGGIYSGVNTTTWTGLSGYQCTIRGTLTTDHFFLNAYKIVGIGRISG